MVRTERVAATFRTRKGAENMVARDAEWATSDDFRAPEGTAMADLIHTPYVRVQTTTLEVRKADDGTFQVVWVTVPVA